MSDQGDDWLIYKTARGLMQSNLELGRMERYEHYRIRCERFETQYPQFADIYRSVENAR